MTKFSPAEKERRRAFFAECDAAYAVMEAAPTEIEWRRMFAAEYKAAMQAASDSGEFVAPTKWESAIRDELARFPTTKFSPAEIERRRVFAAEYNAAYKAMQADPELWARELAERAEWDCTLLDGLEEEY
jgi:hypothetical protein